MRETFNIDKVEKDQGHKYIDLNPPMLHACTVYRYTERDTDW